VGPGTSEKGGLVPLSEDEQRILQEIEQQLYASDPQLVREVSSTTIYRHAGRNLKWAALGFLGGLVLLVLSYRASTVLGGASFLAMLGSAFVFERNLRKMGRAGWRQWSETVRTHGLKDRFGDASQKVRERFKRDEQ
jgi:hypothetical protein